MSTTPATARMVELSGAEALWLVEGSRLGRLVLVQRELAVVRPAGHALEYGRLVVRTPVQGAAVPTTATYQVDEVREASGTGWTVNVTGPADIVTDPHEVAHHRRTLTGWTHGPHDTILRIQPRTVTGFRLTGRADS
ncbi:pyridoxamine 5'-phosphate oxidase family protein [Streptomyces sp. NPDC090106]|uniref:pyridoxamine 5'-phosphate oxidase family protein n=1 Tax=Streptomyces sp. NPDC090106 TaxID=3365946 RepID=UPI00382B8F0D